MGSRAEAISGDIARRTSGFDGLFFTEGVQGCPQGESGCPSRRARGIVPDNPGPEHVAAGEEWAAPPRGSTDKLAFAIRTYTATRVRSCGRPMLPKEGRSKLTRFVAVEGWNWRAERQRGMAG